MGLGKSKLSDSEIAIEANAAIQALRLFVSRDSKLTLKFIIALFNSINIKKSADEQEPHYRALRHLKALGYVIISNNDQQDSIPLFKKKYQCKLKQSDLKRDGQLFATASEQYEQSRSLGMTTRLRTPEDQLNEFIEQLFKLIMSKNIHPEYIKRKFDQGNYLENTELDLVLLQISQIGNFKVTCIPESIIPIFEQQ